MRLVQTLGLAMVALFIILTIAEFVFVSRLRPHRTDLDEGQSGYEGRSIFIQLNVGNPGNYDEGGRARLARLRILGLVRIVALILAAHLLFYGFIL